MVVSVGLVCTHFPPPLLPQNSHHQLTTLFHSTVGALSVPHITIPTLTTLPRSTGESSLSSPDTAESAAVGCSCQSCPRPSSMSWGRRRDITLRHHPAAADRVIWHPSNKYGCCVTSSSAGVKRHETDPEENAARSIPHAQMITWLPFLWRPRTRPGKEGIFCWRLGPRLSCRF